MNNGLASAPVVDGDGRESSLGCLDDGVRERVEQRWEAEAGRAQVAPRQPLRLGGVSLVEQPLDVDGWVPDRRGATDDAERRVGQPLEKDAKRLHQHWPALTLPVYPDEQNLAGYPFLTQAGRDQEI